MIAIILLAVTMIALAYAVYHAYQTEEPVAAAILGSILLLIIVILVVEGCQSG